MRFYFSHPRLKFIILLGLHLWLAYLAAKGLWWFVVSPLAFAYYCWRLNTIPGAFCDLPGWRTAFIVTGTMLMVAFVIWRWLVFVREQRLA